MNGQYLLAKQRKTIRPGKQVLPGFFSLCLLLAFIINLQSCLKESDIDLHSLSQGSKLVAYGVLNPGSDSIKVAVTKTFPVNNNEAVTINDLIVDADIYIYNSAKTDSVKLRRIKEGQPVYGCSQLSFDIRTGETYHLVILAQGYTSVTAATTVPHEAVTWAETTIIPAMVDMDGYFEVGYIFSGLWNKGINNNQQFVESSRKLAVVDTNLIIDRISTSSRLFVDFDERNSMFCFISDPFKIREKNNIQFDIYDQFASYDLQLSFTLVTTDYHFYSYVKNYLFYEDIYDSFDSSSFLDIFRGITPEYTNIDNGLGVFGSCITDEKIIYQHTKK